MVDSVQCTRRVCRSSLSQRPLRTRYCHLRSSASAICSDWHSTGSTRPDCNWTTKFRSQRTSHTDPSATSTTVTGPVGERLQAGTEDAPVLDCPAPLRRFHDSGAGYKHPDLLTYRLVLETRNGDEPPLLYTEGGCQCYIPLHIENRTMQWDTDNALEKLRFTT